VEAENFQGSLSDPGAVVADIGHRFYYLGMCKSPFIRHFDDGREDLILPCGKCLACRIRRRSTWAIRLLHENSAHHISRFITLTYREDVMPRRGNYGVLLKSDLQNFFKRYRKEVKVPGLKYYACGEYGQELGSSYRPHYHAIVYGHAPTKEFLERVWGLGLCDSQPVTADRCYYVAGYVSKKLGLRQYDTADTRPAPFQISSQGLGLKWAQENMIEILYECAILRGQKKLPVPRYYVEKLAEIFPEAIEGFKNRIMEISDLNLTDKILSIFPEGGGRRYSELSADERAVLHDRLRKTGLDYELKLKLRQGTQKGE